MLKKFITIIIIVFLLSLIFALFSSSYKHNKTSSLDIEKKNYINNKDSIKALNQEEIDNRGYLNEVQKNPDEVANKAKSDVSQFIEYIKEAQEKKDTQKLAFFKSRLANLATDQLIQSNELRAIKIPKKHETYVGTSRGHYIDFLVKNTDKEKNTKYLKVEYNNKTHLVESITEYEVRS
ncbi:hypothetical protein [Staphylococcus simulans]|uniref:hypothetical protein n=1 Tax=Staphylococcus simulans TaxID=1286 RepID=UPI000D1DF2B9|nr:hypothetical protein [Staphylococcus simulans]PTJ36436.1 hypothetical protein BU024_10255 [Staphylococcus simulans]